MFLSFCTSEISVTIPDSGFKMAADRGFFLFHKKKNRYIGVVQPRMLLKCEWCLRLYYEKCQESDWIRIRCTDTAERLVESLCNLSIQTSKNSSIAKFVRGVRLVSWKVGVEARMMPICFDLRKMLWFLRYAHIRTVSGHFCVTRPSTVVVRSRLLIFGR